MVIDFSFGNLGFTFWLILHFGMHGRLHISLLSLWIFEINSLFRKSHVDYSIVSSNLGYITGDQSVLQLNPYYAATLGEIASGCLIGVGRLMGVLFTVLNRGWPLNKWPLNRGSTVSEFVSDLTIRVCMDLKFN